MQRSPAEINQSRKATASGWIGSVLEYYDFFIYATAASLIFPQVFFPSGNPRVAIVASLATYGVGYMARPIGAIFLGHWGDTRGRKNVLIVCLLIMGLSTLAVGVLPTYQQAGMWAPVLLVTLRLAQGFAVAGEMSGASSMILEHAPHGRRGYYASFTLQGVQAGQVLAAAVFLPLAYWLPEQDFNTWGWRIPFLLSFFVIIAGYLIRRKVTETPAFREARERGAVATAPVLEAFRYCWRDMLRVTTMALMNVIAVVATIFGAAYAVQPAYGIGFSRYVYLWIPVLGNLLAVLIIPFVGRLSDRIGRRPPIIVGAVCSGLLSYAYLYAISIRNVPLAIALSLLMWGVVYQGYNAVFPSFYPELFPTRMRVSSVAIAQNSGSFVTAMLPAMFAAVSPPGAMHIPLTIGSITLAITLLSALSAWSARETYRLQLRDLGDPRALPSDPVEEPALRTGLIGAGILLSSAPAIHMDEAAAQGQPCTYDLFDLERVPGGVDAVPALLDECERRGFAGLNITYPCKQSVVPLLHELSAEAAALQSVNTVLFRAGRRIGHNTDWWGFAESFRSGLADADLARVALIGAGGAGAAVGYAALTLGAAELRIVDADRARSAALAARLAALFPARHVFAADGVEPALDRASGLIHATPTGMQKLPGMPVPAELLQPSMWVADIVYVPLETSLLRAARQRGCRTLDGSGMAVLQAARALELFSGLAPDTARMLRGFTSRLAQSHSPAAGIQAG